MRLVVLALVVTIALAGCVRSAPAPAPKSNDSAPSAPASTTADHAIDLRAANATAAPRVVTKVWNGTITGAGYGNEENRVCCFYEDSPTDENVAVTFPVGPGATFLRLTLTWADPKSDLDLQVFAPDFQESTVPVNGSGPSTHTGHYYIDDNGTYAAGDSPAKIQVASLEAFAKAGDWSVSIGAKNAMELPFTLTAQVWYGGRPPS